MTHIGVSKEAYLINKARMEKQFLATSIKVRMYMPSFKVLNQSDTRP